MKMTQGHLLLGALALLLPLLAPRPCQATSSPSSIPTPIPTSTTSSCSPEHGFPLPAAAGLSAGCACHDCYTGADCATLIPDCLVETRVAEATLWTAWFAEQAAAGADLTTSVPADFYPAYLNTPRLIPPAPVAADDPSFDAITRALNTSIRSLHASVGNVDADGHYLVLASGGVQLIDAAFYALAQGANVNRTMHVYSQPPYYGHFRLAANLNPLTAFVADPTQAPTPRDIIEILASPSNPDGRRLAPRVPGAGALITDLVYDFPHYRPSAGLGRRADDVMIFSLSKLSGYAASRIGWAFVRSPQVAQAMSNYIFLQSTAPSVEAQLRAVKILRAVTASIGTPTDFFDFARAQLDVRWARLEQVFAGQTRFSIAGGRGMIFLWLRCNNAADAADCAAPFATVGIATENGLGFGANTSFARICMGHYNDTFELLIARMQKLFHPPAAALGSARGSLRTAAIRLDSVDLDSLTAADRRRAVEVVPRPAFRGEDFASMARRLNGHLQRFAKLGADPTPCDRFSVDELHALQARFAAVRSRDMQTIYHDAGDSRRLAFGDPSVSLADNVALEKKLSTASPNDAVAIRDALCHRLVMQYVHHLTQAQRAALGGAGDAGKAAGVGGERFPLPMLPSSHLQARPTQAGGAAAWDTLHPLSRAVYHNATSCITCHITSTSPMHSSSASAASEAAGSAAGGVHVASQRPVVPLWPEEFDVEFGLYTLDAKNVSSHMHYSSLVPGMHIHHDQCVRGFLPQMPDVTGSCELIFNAKGLWLTWAGGKGDATKENNSNDTQCCQLVAADMSVNLGRNETDGFDFVGNTTTTDYWGNEVAAAMFVDSARLAPPSGITILINAHTLENVHYLDGGAFQLEWLLKPRVLRPQPAALFATPDLPGCSSFCAGSAGNAGVAGAPKGPSGSTDSNSAANGIDVQARRYHALAAVAAAAEQ